MPLPDLDASGDLPVGVHRAPIDEVVDRFGKNTPQRITIAERLKRTYALAKNTGGLARFIMFGSFVTDKPAPNDVDIFLLMNDLFDVTKVTGEALIVFDHPAAQSYFGASIFWARQLAALGGEIAAVEHWQIKRDGTRRGIVEVI